MHFLGNVFLKHKEMHLLPHSTVMNALKKKSISDLARIKCSPCSVSNVYADASILIPYNIYFTET